MKDPDYSNRELDEKFDRIKAQLDRIETQTTATNGKVRKITIAMVALGFFSVGVGIQQIGPILMLLL